MALARVVSFEGVTDERLQEIGRQLEAGELPEGLPTKEVTILHDPEGQRALVILVFETEADYEQGDEILRAMPADETPGRRTSLRKYQVAARTEL
jgi:hypothetical protein